MSEEHYEAAMDAMSDAIAEHAHEIFNDGELNDEIAEAIFNGKWDETIIIYLQHILPEQLFKEVLECFKR